LPQQAAIYRRRGAARAASAAPAPARRRRSREWWQGERHIPPCLPCPGWSLPLLLLPSPLPSMQRCHALPAIGESFRRCARYAARAAPSVAPPAAMLRAQPARPPPQARLLQAALHESPAAQMLLRNERPECWWREGDRQVAACTRYSSRYRRHGKAWRMRLRLPGEESMAAAPATPHCAETPALRR